MFDYHIHSEYSVDGKMTMDEACQRAIELGLDEIVFTDHIDLDWPDSGPHFDMDDIGCYIESIEVMQDRYKGILNVKKGMELGLQPSLMEEFDLIVDTFPVDFIIGSVHVVDGMDPYGGKYYHGKSKEEGYIRYYEEILAILETFDRFDVLGHIDYVKRYFPMEWEAGEHLYGLDVIDEIFKILIEKGKGIEVNTSGYRHVSDAPMPNIDIVKKFHHMGGNIITIGSDAHSTEALGYSFDRAIRELKEAGITELAKFTERELELVSI